MLKPVNLITNTVMNNKFEHPYIKQRMLDVVNRSNLIHLLTWWDESKLIVNNHTLCLKDYPHVQVFQEASYNTKTHQVLNATETLKAYFNLNFPQAYYVAQYFYKKVFKIQISNYCKEKYTLADELSTTANENLNSILDDNLLFQNDHITAMSRCYAFLCKSKHIDRSVLLDMVNRQVLIMDSDMMLNFLTYDQDGNVISNIKMSTLTKKPIKEKFSIERNTGFLYTSKYQFEKQNYKTVFVFETIIELLSFITLQKQFDFASADKGRVYLSLEGLRFDTLNALLEKYQSVTKVIFCLGNDTAAIDSVKKYVPRRELSVCDYQPMLRDYSLKHHFVATWNDLVCLISPPKSHKLA